MKYHDAIIYEERGKYKVVVRIADTVLVDARRLLDALDRGEETLEMTPAKAKNQYPFAVIKRGNGDVQLRVTKRWE